MRQLSIAEVLTIIRRVKGPLPYPGLLIYHVEMNLYPDCEEYINHSK